MNADVSPNINAGISFIGNNAEKSFRSKRFAAGGHKAAGVELAADPRSRQAGIIPGEDGTDEIRFRRDNLIMSVRSAGISKNLCAVIQAALGVVHHSAGDVLAELAGIPFRSGLQHSLQEHAGGPFRNGLHCVKDFDTVTAEASFEKCAFFPVATEPVNLP